MRTYGIFKQLIGRGLQPNSRMPGSENRLWESATEGREGGAVKLPMAVSICCFGVLSVLKGFGGIVRQLDAERRARAATSDAAADC